MSTGGYTFQDMRRTLCILNWHYGRGEVIEIRQFENGRGLFVRKPYGGREETRTFRLINGTIYALGHQRKVAITQGPEA